MRIVVIGAGAWGTTIASVATAHADVRLWAFEPEVVEDVNTNHRNERYLPDVSLSPALTATGDLAEAKASAFAPWTEAITVSTDANPDDLAATAHQSVLAG